MWISLYWTFAHLLRNNRNITINVNYTTGITYKIGHRYLENKSQTWSLYDKVCFNTVVNYIPIVRLITIQTIVKPKQAGTCGRGIRNEQMSNTNTILIWNGMEQIQFIYFQYYMQYYTVHHKDTCCCCCQMLLGIYTPCARVLFSSLDVCSHFSPVVAWSCCHPSWPIEQWKCQLRSLAQQAQSFISECLLQDWQSGWSPCAWSFFQRSMCCWDQPVEPWLLTLDLSRCLVLELCSFRALLFCLGFDCGMGCMSLSLLVKVWVLLKLQSIAFFYKVDCPLFLPFLQLFLFHFSFSRDLR